MDNSKNLQEELTNHYKRHQVSVLVGAGFSKNVYPKFPLWETLLFDLMIDLYGTKIREAYEVYLHTQRLPFFMNYQLFKDFQLKRIAEEKGFLNIVSEYIKKKGNRESMDVYIEKHIPFLDKSGGKLHFNLDPSFVVQPQDLDVHAELLKCNWLDVYTTNYDNLLERTAEEWDFPYNLVTGDYELGKNTDARNIIKLHGTLAKDSINGDFMFDNDNSLRYIIAKEDYDTYPFKHEAFTQLMRIAMLKGVFLLIGFSGTDPNFLAWLNWMRDVLDKDPQRNSLRNIKVFLLLLKNEGSSDEQKLYFKNHRIGVIYLDNDDLLEEITGIKASSGGCNLSVADKFRFLFKYIRNADTTTSDNGNREKDSYKKLWSRIDGLVKKPEELAQTVEELSSLPHYRILDNTVWQERVMDELYFIKEQWDENQKETASLVLRDISLLAVLMFSDKHSEEASTLEIWNDVYALKQLAFNDYIPKIDPENDRDHYYNLLHYAYNLNLTKLYELLKKWKPTNWYVQNWASFNAYSNKKQSVDALDLYISQASDTQERYHASILRNCIDYQIPSRYTYYEYGDIPNFYSAKRQFIQETKKSAEDIKPHGWVGSEYKFGNDVSKIRGGIMFLDLLMKSGFMLSYRSVSLVSSKEWYPVFTQLYQMFPYPSLFYSLTINDNNIITRIGQDLAYSEHLREVLPDMLMKLLNCIKNDLYIGYWESYWKIAKELAIAVNPEIWIDIFIEILDNRILPQIKNFTYSTEPYMFAKKMVEYISDSTQQSKVFAIFVKYVMTDPISIGDILLNLDKNFEADEETIASLKIVFETLPITKTHYLAASLLENKAIIAQVAPLISQKILDEDVNTGPADRLSTLHTLTYLCNKNGESIGKIKAEILSKNIWDCGITSKTSRSKPMYLDLTRICEDIEWNKEELLQIFNNIDANLSLLESAKLHDDWFANDYANLVNSMRVFVNRHENTSGLQDISSALCKRCNIMLDKLLDGSNFYHALSSDDHTRIAIYGNNLLMSIERHGLAKYNTEVVMCLVRALFPDQKCLHFILSMISFLAEKYKQEMSSDNYREMLLSILDKYADFDFSESNESIPHIFYYLKRIAKSFEEYSEMRPSVNYWLNNEMANRFNV